MLHGARGGTRTHMTLRSANFKSAAATNYATRAGDVSYHAYIHVERMHVGGDVGRDRTGA